MNAILKPYIVYSNVDFTIILNAINKETAIKLGKMIFETEKGISPDETTGIDAEPLLTYLSYGYMHIRREE